jgi:peptide deformylase
MNRSREANPQMPPSSAAPPVTRPIVEAGHPVLRQVARPLTRDEILSPATARLIEIMRETMRAAPGVGLAAPQIGESLAIAVIEDRAEYQAQLPDEDLKARGRVPVPFHVIINPRITVTDAGPAEFAEGCLSVPGYSAVTPRARAVHVDALDHRGEPIALDASGWYARILQHEIDHLQGTLYVDRMNTRTFTSQRQALAALANAASDARGR